MRTTVTEHDGNMLARIEDDDLVFEVSFETVEPTDVTLRFRRDGEKVGSIYTAGRDYLNANPPQTGVFSSLRC